MNYPRNVVLSPWNDWEFVSITQKINLNYLTILCNNKITKHEYKIPKLRRDRGFVKNVLNDGFYVTPVSRWRN